MRELFGIPVILDSSVPKDTAFLMPSDVKAAIDMACAADVVARHGIISQALADDVYRAAIESIETAAKERRIGVIKNLC